MLLQSILSFFLFIQLTKEAQCQFEEAVEAKVGEFPYQVSIQYFWTSGNMHADSGIILDDRHVLTVGSAISPNPGLAYSVVSGRQKLGNVIVGQRHNIERITHHPLYSSVTQPHLNSLAIIRVVEPFRFSSSTQPARLPTTNSTTVKIGETGVLSGYHLILIRNNLYKIHVPTISQSVCEEFGGNGTIKAGMFCGGFILEGGCVDMTGDFDNGGPLTCLEHEDDPNSEFICGLKSYQKYSSDPNFGYPVVFQEIAPYIDWIWATVSN